MNRCLATKLNTNIHGMRKEFEFGNLERTLIYASLISVTRSDLNS